jgi:hypothetical protein
MVSARANPAAERINIGTPAIITDIREVNELMASRASLLQFMCCFLLHWAAFPVHALLRGSGEQEAITSPNRETVAKAGNINNPCGSSGLSNTL